MNFIKNITNRINNLLTIHNLHINDFRFVSINNDVIKILYLNNFLFYINFNQYTIHDFNSPHSQKWIDYQNYIINNIIRCINNKTFYDHVFLIYHITNNYTSLNNTINSLKNQLRIPHIILCSTNNNDTTYAINENIEYIELNKKSSIGSRLQSGLNYIKQNYPNIIGISISNGSELFLNNWTQVCINYSNKYDLIGSTSDFIIDHKKPDDLFKRTINQNQYYDVINKKIIDSYILFSGIFIHIDILKKSSWHIFKDTNSKLQLDTINHLADFFNNIKIIDESYYIQVFQGKDLAQSIQYMTAKNYLIIDKCILDFNKKQFINKYLENTMMPIKINDLTLDFSKNNDNISISSQDAKNIDKHSVNPIFKINYEPKNKIIPQRIIKNISFNMNYITIPNLISIVLPIYDNNINIIECIKSIINQTYNEWELLIINCYLIQDDVIKYINSIKTDKIKIINLYDLNISNDINSVKYKMSDILNYGLSMSTGYYWTCILDNNILNPDCLKILINKIKHNYDFIYSDYSLKLNNKIIPIHLDEYNSINLLTCCKKIFCCLWKIDFIKKIGFFNTEFDKFQVYDFIIRTFIASQFIYHINELLMIRPINQLYNLEDNEFIETNKIINKIDNDYKCSDIFRSIININETNKFIIYITKNNIINPVIDKYLLKYYQDNKINIIYICNNFINNKISNSFININHQLFDIFNSKFKIKLTPIVFLYDHFEFKNYCNIISNNKIYCPKHNDTNFENFDCYFNHILIMNQNFDSIKSIEFNNDNKSKIIKNFNHFDSIIAKSIRKLHKFAFKIGLMADYDDFGYKITKKYINQIFKNCIIQCINLKNYRNFDLIIVSCDHKSFNKLWHREYLDRQAILKTLVLEEKNIYFVNMRNNINDTNLRISDLINNNHDDYNDYHNEYNHYIYDNYYKLFNIKSKSRSQNSKIIGLYLDDNFIDLEKLNYKITQSGYHLHRFIYTNKIKSEYNKNIQKDTDYEINYCEKLSEIENKFITSKIIFTNNYHVVLFCLVNKIPVVSLINNNSIKKLYQKFNITNMILDVNIYDNDTLINKMHKYIEINNIVGLDINNNSINNNSHLKLKMDILKQNLKVMHIGSCKIYDNDITRLMIHDLEKICELKNININENENENKWIEKYEARPIKYPNKFVKYLIHDKIIEEIKLFKPNIIITNSNGITFNKKTLKYLDDMKIIKVGISLSDPDSYYYHGEIYFKNYDYFYTNCKHTLLHKYKQNIDIKHDSVNIDLMQYASSTKLSLVKEKKYDIIVVGEGRSERIKIIDKLKKRFNVNVYGDGWPSNYNTHHINGSEYIQNLNSGYIYLSFGQTTGGNMKVKVGLFEAAACKLVLVTEESDDVNDFFIPDVEIITYKKGDINGLVHKLNIILNDKNKMTILANNSYNKFIEKHQWINRWHHIFDNII